MDAVELLFLGTGTSAGIPMIGCHCETCRSTDPRDRRSRPSVVISYRDASVLIDSGPELRLQCVTHSVDRIDAVVYTHGHADHIMGLDDLRRFNALKRGPLDLYCNSDTLRTLQTCFAYAFREPDPASRLFRPHLRPHIIEGPFAIADVTWTPIPLIHGSVPVLGFRIGNLAYCTDVNLIPPASMDLLHDLDVLVLDALQHTKHATHFTVEEAVDVARQIRARQTYFTHIAHGVMHSRTALPDNIHLAYDGLRVQASLSTDPALR